MTVGIVMGSDSDWPVMKAAAEVCAEFGVTFEADVISAHRMPVEMIEYGRQAHGRGLKVLIAGAGGAAHLPGMLAAVTPLPVVGVPVPLQHLDGLGSLLSTAPTPPGAPAPARPPTCGGGSSPSRPPGASPPRRRGRRSVPRPPVPASASSPGAPPA